MLADQIEARFAFNLNDSYDAEVELRIQINRSEVTAT